MELGIYIFDNYENCFHFLQLMEIKNLGKYLSFEAYSFSLVECFTPPKTCRNSIFSSAQPK